MQAIAQQIGWLVFLATVMVSVGHVTKALIVLILSQAAQGQQVDSDDAFRAIIQIVESFFKLAYMRWLATVCSVATFSTLMYMGLDGYSSFGFSVVTFVIAAIVTPKVMISIRRIASNVSSLMKRSDSE